MYRPRCQFHLLAIALASRGVVLVLGVLSSFICTKFRQKQLSRFVPSSRMLCSRKQHVLLSSHRHKRQLLVPESLNRRFNLIKTQIGKSFYLLTNGRKRNKRKTGACSCYLAVLLLSTPACNFLPNAPCPNKMWQWWHSIGECNCFQPSQNSASDCHIDKLNFTLNVPTLIQ